MQLGKRRIELERSFAMRTEDMRTRALEAEARRVEAKDARSVAQHSRSLPINTIV